MADLRNITYRFVLLGYLFLTSVLLAAQSDTNPFDLQHRLNRKLGRDTTKTVAPSNPFDIESRVSNAAELTPTAEPTSEEQSVPAAAAPSNPFDIRRPYNKLIDPVESPSATVPSIIPADVETPVNTKGGFIFWSLLGLMIFLALMITLYRNLLGKIYRAFINENILKLLQREQGAIISPPYWLLYLLYFASAGTFIFQLARYYNYLPHTFLSLAFCVLGITVFFLIKHLLLKIIEWIFPVSKTIKQYSFTIVVFNIILGIILIPFNIFIAFAQDNLTSTGVFFGLLAVSGVYLFRLLRAIMISTKHLMFHKFHFFMYLCTIELAPLVIIIKLILNGASIQ